MISHPSFLDHGHAVDYFEVAVRGERLLVDRLKHEIFDREKKLLASCRRLRYLNDQLEHNKRKLIEVREDKK